MPTTPSGFSEAGLRRLRDVLARHVESGKIPGARRPGQPRRGETHVEAIGTMRHDGGAPMRRDTIFRMASTSKPVAVAAAMVLLDECRLRLDDPVEQWLPELADRQVLKRIDGPLDDTVPARAADHRTGPADLHVRARHGYDGDGLRRSWARSSSRASRPTGRCRCPSRTSGCAASARFR